MTATDRFKSVYDALVTLRGRPPTQVEVASELGVSRAFTSTLFKRHGIPGRSGTQARVAMAQAKTENMRALRKAHRLEVQLLVADQLVAKPDETIAKIGEDLGVSASVVSYVSAACGMRRAYRFTAEEDSIVRTHGAEEAGQLLNRNPMVIRQRKKVLAQGAKAKALPLEEIWAMAATGADRKKICKRLKVAPSKVSAVLTYLPVYLERHPDRPPALGVHS